VVLALFLFCERQILRHYIAERYYILFVAGMLVAELIRNPKLAAWLRTRLAACIGLAALLSEVFFCPTAYDALPPILLLIFLAPVAAGNSYFKLFSLPGSIVLGEVSYGIYLLHGILLYVAANTLVYRPGIYLLPMMAPVVFAVAVLAHRFVEMPAIDFGRRLSRCIPEIQLRIPGFRSQGALSSEQTTGAENVP
jgi:peptidoglycan/LPS O-acetylase OafA/YrhL